MQIFWSAEMRRRTNLRRGCFESFKMFKNNLLRHETKIWLELPEMVFFARSIDNEDAASSISGYKFFRCVRPEVWILMFCKIHWGRRRKIKAPTCSCWRPTAAANLRKFQTGTTILKTALSALETEYLISRPPNPEEEFMKLRTTPDTGVQNCERMLRLAY